MIIESILKLIFDDISAGLVVFDRNQKLLFPNKKALKILGTNREDIKGANPLEVIYGRLNVEDFEIINIDCKNSAQIIFANKNNAHYLIRCFFVPKMLFRPCYIMTIVDVSKIKEYEEARVNKRVSYLTKSIIEFIPDILFVINNDSRVIFWNKEAEDATYVKKEETLGKDNYEYAVPLYGKRCPILVDFALRDVKPEKSTGYSDIEIDEDTITAISEHAVLKGEKRVLWEKAGKFYNEEGNVMGAIEIVRDITEMRKMQKRLKFMAERDSLTGIYNRRQLEVLLIHELDRIKRTKETLTLFYIDVDNLKGVNDEFGHDEGDKLLVNLADTLKNGLRKSDIISRVGGDEFIVIITDLLKGKAVKLINRLRNNLVKESKNLPYDINFSYGVFEIRPDNKFSVKEIIAKADKDMYIMKKNR